MKKLPIKRDPDHELEVIAIGICCLIALAAILFILCTCVVFLNRFEKNRIPETAAPTESVSVLVPVERKKPDPEPLPLKREFYIGNKKFPEDLQNLLESELEKYNDQFFILYAIAQMFTESSFNLGAVSPDGLDYGLYQFRKRYWNDNLTLAGLSNFDILDKQAQIMVYCYKVDQQLKAGENIKTIISDHYSGGCFYAADYVDRVLKNYDKIEVILHE